MDQLNRELQDAKDIQRHSATPAELAEQSDTGIASEVATISKAVGNNAALADLAETMAQLVRTLKTESTDTNSLLHAICQSAVDQIPGADQASITLVTANSSVESPVIIGDLAARSDKLQEELGEGPCIRSALSADTVHIRDMSREKRWPTFCQAAARAGIRSMLCFALYVDGDSFGALNLHSATVNAFDGDAESIGNLFAAHAAVAFASVRERDTIRAAITNRDVIGQAKGMLMERYRIDSDQAFHLLTRLSQTSNTKLFEVAAQVVAAGPGE